MSENELLTVENLSVTTESGAGIRLVESISFGLRRGERMALVGESGSGKSVSARAVLGLDRELGLAGSIRFDGVELVGTPEKKLARLRGDRIGMVFQDPMSSLNPLMSIGTQVMEPLRAHGMGARAARRTAAATLEELGVSNAAERMKAYPHEFSGGMRQRVVLAMALVGEPDLLIADEPTTALDVRVQAQVMELLSRVARERELAVLFITHDVGIVGDFADRVVVMYSGAAVESAPVDDFFARPAHPYTRGLLATVPRLDDDTRLVPLPGSPPHPKSRPTGCTFAARCAFATELCRRERPPLVARTVAEASVACHYAADRIGGPAARPTPAGVR
jgi:oligopeptide/dipeptide ABC transporter ATP-binding protein